MCVCVRERERERDFVKAIEWKRELKWALKAQRFCCCCCCCVMTKQVPVPRPHHSLLAILSSSSCFSPTFSFPLSPLIVCTLVCLSVCLSLCLSKLASISRPPNPFSLFGRPRNHVVAHLRRRRLLNCYEQGRFEPGSLYDIFALGESFYMLWPDRIIRTFNKKK